MDREFVKMVDQSLVAITVVTVMILKGIWDKGAGILSTFR